MKIKKIDIQSIDGFLIGNAENPEAGTGCTVIISEKGAVAGVDVRGGGPATRETDLLRSENTVETINAVVLSGGSAFGLEAASGVMRELASKGIGFKVGDITVPIVSGASCFDLAVGSSDVFPDVEMGREAVRNAYSGVFETGNHGAGTGASVGKMMGMDRAMKTGIGSFACGDESVQVGAIAAVNACGDVYNGAGNIIAGLRTPDGSAIYGTIKVLKDMIHPLEGEATEDNQEIDFSELSSEPVVKVVVQEETSDSQPVSDKSKSDIALAIQEAYEREAALAAMPQETETVSDNTEAAAEMDAVTEEQADEPDSPETSAEVPSEPDPQAEIESEEPEAEAESSDEKEPAYEESAPPVAEPAEPSEPDTPAEPDPYELSQEEKDDMGYDIPFNTTIACLITNAKLTKSQANKLASILHDAYARAIKPVHSTLDGDTIFVMSTCTEDVNFDAFAALATDVMQYAIIDGAQKAEGAYGLPAARDIIQK